VRFFNIKSRERSIFKGDFKDTIKKAAILKLTPFFEVLTGEQLVAITTRVKHNKYPGDTLLFREGDLPEDFYIICSGKISLYKSLSGWKTENFATLSEGDIFGEMGVLTGSPRSLSARIISKSAQIYSVSGKDFFYMLRKYPDLSLNVAKVLSKRLEEANKKVVNFLEDERVYVKEKFLESRKKTDIVSAVPLFSVLPEKDLEKLSSKIRLKRFSGPSVLFNEGDSVDSVYIIKSGTVNLYKNLFQPGDIRDYLTLGKGEILGEMGVVSASPRSLSARVTEEKIEMYVIGKDDFLYMLRRYPELNINLIKILCRRIADTNRRLVSFI